MFFPERIRQIKKGDKVLEIGPGSSPHPRADILLEKNFTENEAKKQRGNHHPLHTNKELIYYDGDKFPFHDKAFDYIICSHVIEHVEDVESFCREIFRVGRKGYIEFPTIYYEYIYNFYVHKQLINYSSRILWYMKKEVSGLGKFQSIQKMYYRSLELGYSDLIEDLKELMFFGFEWMEPFQVKKVSSIEDLIGSVNLNGLPNRHRYIRHVLRWIQKII